MSVAMAGFAALILGGQKGPAAWKAEAERQLAAGKFQQASEAYFKSAEAYAAKGDPNAAMVWCPNTIPEQSIDSYYPGEQWVDWVGVNFYSVMYNDADRARAAEWRQPTDSLDYVYKKYSAKHPMMVGEWAASHRSSIDDYDRPEFAAEKMAQFFRTVPLRYPRLKAASWLSFNTFKYARQERQLNNYALFDNPAVARAYMSEIEDPYLLSKVGVSAPVRWKKVSSGRAGQTVRVFVRSYESYPTVRVDWGTGSRTIAGRELKMGPLEVTLPSLGSGSWVEATVRDGKGRVALKKRFPLAP